MEKERENLFKNTGFTKEDTSTKCKEPNDIFMDRKLFGEFHHLFPQLKKYPKKFFQYMRMSKEAFDYILYEVKPKLTKKWCNFHKSSAIKEEERLVITLR